MAEVKDTKHSASKRMGLHAAVRLASKVIAYYYPMGAFVHHNPLHGFENINFEDALMQGKRLFGANEYLHEDTYIEYLREGRVDADQLHKFIKETAEEKGLTGTATVGGMEVTPFDALRASFEHKISSEGITADPETTEGLVGHLTSEIDAYDFEEELKKSVQEGTASLGRSTTISSWCDKVLSTDDEDNTNFSINTELIKWCEGFLDEGHADWAMPGKDKTLYGAWRYIASKELSHHGIKDMAGKLASLPEKSEDCLADCLEALGIGEDIVHSYITLHLAALAGWAGYIKWREDQKEHPWQVTYPAHLVDFVAIRLWYEKELATIVCRERLGIGANIDEITKYMLKSPLDYFFRLERDEGLVPSAFSEEVDRIIYCGSNSNTHWEALKVEYSGAATEIRTRERAEFYVRNLLLLGESLKIDASDLLNSKAVDLVKAARWMTSLSDSEKGFVWLRSYEDTYRNTLLGQLTENVKTRDKDGPDKRPDSQSVFCIDVRSEPFRRHMESTGNHETFGFAGFFATFIKFRALGKSHETYQFPVIMTAKNKAREIPREGQGDLIPKHRTRGKLNKAAYTLLYDLKGDVITPYVMVESLGWIYCVPIFGKSWFVGLYRRASKWMKKLWMPSLKTTITTDKLSKEEAQDVLSFNQHLIIRRALVDRFKGRGLGVSDEFVEYLRLRAIGEEAEAPESNITEYEVGGFITDLRENYRINPRWASASLGRIMQLGYTLDEQIFTVGFVLRAMGLTRNFARIIAFCGHGSTTENNPFEAALDCGACGGNSGHPNARMIAALANKPAVREALKDQDIIIPEDTHFVAARHDTTTDAVTLYDLDDIPETHGEDLERLKRDLLTAGKLNSQERCMRLPDIGEKLDPEKAWEIVHNKSAHWGQVRPEWGLSGNAAFIIGRHYLTQKTDLRGKVFLHSYNHKVDTDCKALEVIMTAPQVVAQWINMEHYFSTVDNTVYGSGSKIYHNITGRIAIMYGTHSDIRAGLPLQTVMKGGDEPFHEPVRMTSFIEAPIPDIQKIIDRHPMLQNHYDHEWVFLISIDPDTGEFNRYVANKGWEPCQ